MDETNPLLDSRKIELIIEMNTKKLMKEISSLKEDIKSINDSIMQLKSVVRTSGMQHSAAPPPIPRKEETPKGESVGEKEVKENPDQSNRKVPPTEISIEKYFYCGNK